MRECVTTIIQLQHLAADALKRCTSPPDTLLRVISYVLRDISHVE